MGLYIRKAISVGPFRFNLSGAGVGISVGVPGFRIGASPRGNYIHVGRGGVYYRTTIPRKPAPRDLPPPLPVDGHASDVVMNEIESAMASTIVDSDSASLVAEMHAKRRMWRLWPWVLGFGIAGLVAILNSWPAAPAWFTYLCVATVGIGTLGASVFDQVRKTTVLMYEFEPGAEQRFANFQTAFDGLRQCARTWHISAEGRVKDKKYHAGASSLISRKGISLGIRNPPYVKTNVAVPYIPVGKQTLYFLPDVVLVFEPGGVGAVSYTNLTIESAPTRFIEDEGVPRDSKVVDRTWRYVNKGGGPDRRFKDNKELPIALYEELRLSSATGLNEVIQASRTGVSERLIQAVRALG